MVERLSRNNPEFFQSFVKKAGLAWPVNTRFTFVDRPRIMTPPDGRDHTVLLPLALRGTRNPRELKYLESGYAHEIGHAWLAENISTILASPMVDISESDPRRAEKMRIVEAATNFVNVWANDAVVDILDRKDLADEQIRHWLSTAIRTLRHNTNVFASQFTIHSAISSRHDLPNMADQLRATARGASRHLGTEKIGQMERLTEVCRNLPFVTRNPENTIEVYEKTASKHVEILGLSPKPHLADFDGHRVWTFA